jgi:hypothetical protein
MMRIHCSATFLVLFLAAAGPNLHGQLLVPIKPGTTAGAYGAQWQTELVLTNMGDTPLTVTGHVPEGASIPPKASVFVRNVLVSCSAPGIILNVHEAGVEQFAASLRTRDLSRQFETAGTTIPLVTLSDTYALNLGIVDVPMEPGFRSTLRVYGLDYLARGNVDRVRFYALDPDGMLPGHDAADRLILEMPTRFAPPVSNGVVNPTHCPQYFEIALDQVPELANAGRIRIEVDSLDNARPYWAFVAVTHNQTQHVTLILPTRTR